MSVSTAVGVYRIPISNVWLVVPGVSVAGTVGVIRGTPASWKKGAPDRSATPVTAPGPLPTLLTWSPPDAVVLSCVGGNVMVPPGAMGSMFGLLPLVGVMK